MDNALIAMLRVCKLVVAVMLILSACSTLPLWVAGRPFQQPALVILAFTTPIVVLIIAVQGFLLSRWC